MLFSIVLMFCYVYHSPKIGNYNDKKAVVIDHNTITAGGNRSSHNNAESVNVLYIGGNAKTVKNWDDASVSVISTPDALTINANTETDKNRVWANADTTENK